MLINLYNTPFGVYPCGVFDSINPEYTIDEIIHTGKREGEKRIFMVIGHSAKEKFTLKIRNRRNLSDDEIRQKTLETYYRAKAAK
jgi:hypothetical protein